MFENLQSLSAASTALNVEGTKVVSTQLDIAGDLVIPEGITEIEAHAFEGALITRVHFPSTLKVIGQAAFQDCRNLVSISFAEGASITTIMHHAFAFCKSLVDIEIPETVTFIGEEAFAHCADYSTRLIIPKVVIPKSAYVYGYCFKDTPIDLLCIKSDIVIHHAYAQAKAFRISWETSCREIPERTFENCPYLCEFSFSDVTNLKVISASAFENCTELYSMHLPEGVTVVRRAAFKNSGLQFFKAPTTLKVIGEEALANTPCLSIDLEGTSLQAVGDYAFRNTNITTLTLDGNIKMLDFNIVFECKHLICLRIGKDVEFFLDCKKCSKSHLVDDIAGFDMALYIEGTETVCSSNIIAPLIFAREGSAIAKTDYGRSREYSRLKMNTDKLIEGMETAYGRCTKPSGIIIYY